MASVQQGPLSCSHRGGSSSWVCWTAACVAADQSLSPTSFHGDEKWVSISSEGFSAVVSHAWFIHVSPNFSVLFYCNISNINFKMCHKHLFKDRKLAFQVYIQFCYFALLLTGNRACRSQTYTVGMQPVLQKYSSSLNFNLLSQAKGTFHYSCLNFLKDSFLLHCWGQTLDLAHSRQALHHVATCVCCPKIPKLKVFFICYLMTQIPKLMTWYTVGYDQANLTFISFNLPFSMLFRI